MRHFYQVKHESSLLLRSRSQTHARTRAHNFYTQTHTACAEAGTRVYSNYGNFFFLSFFLSFLLSFCSIANSAARCRPVLRIKQVRTPKQASPSLSTPPYQCAFGGGGKKPVIRERSATNSSSISEHEFHKRHIHAHTHILHNLIVHARSHKRRKRALRSPLFHYLGYSSHPSAPHSPSAWTFLANSRTYARAPRHVPGPATTFLAQRASPTGPIYPFLFATRGTQCQNATLLSSLHFPTPLGQQQKLKDKEEEKASKDAPALLFCGSTGPLPTRRPACSPSERKADCFLSTSQRSCCTVACCGGAAGPCTPFVSCRRFPSYHQAL